MVKLIVVNHFGDCRRNLPSTESGLNVRRQPTSQLADNGRQETDHIRRYGFRASWSPSPLPSWCLVSQWRRCVATDVSLRAVPCPGRWGSYRRAVQRDTQRTLLRQRRTRRRRRRRHTGGQPDEEKRHQLAALQGDNQTDRWSSGSYALVETNV